MYNILKREEQNNKLRAEIEALTREGEILQIKINQFRQQPFNLLKQLLEDELNGEELVNNFQKAMNENNIEDLKELLPKIVPFIYMALNFSSFNIMALMEHKPEEVMKVIFEHSDMLQSKLLIFQRMLENKVINNKTFDSIAKYTKGLDHFKDCNYN